MALDAKGRVFLSALAENGDKPLSEVDVMKARGLVKTLCREPKEQQA